jgi:cell division protein FtsL
MNQKAFILLFVGILVTAAGLIYSYNTTSTATVKREAIEKAEVRTSAPVEAIIWESMSQAILGSGSIN